MHYLTPAWIDAADRAMRAAAMTAPAEPLVIDQHIDGVISYRVVISPTPSMTPLDQTPPATVADVVFHLTLSTAKAIATGETDAHQAFLLGHLGFEGDIELLLQRRPSLEWLAEALSPIVAATTF